MNMTIKEMHKEIKKTAKEGMELRERTTREFKESKEWYIRAEKHFTDLADYLKSSKVNYLRKDEIKFMLKRSQHYLRTVKRIHNEYIKQAIENGELSATDLIKR